MTLAFRSILLTSSMIKHGNPYSVRVIAVNGAGDGTPAEADGLPDLWASAPTNVQAAPTQDSITLNWDAPKNPCFTGYTIYRKGPSDGDYVEHAAGIPKVSTSYTDTGLAAESEYFYRVQAIYDPGRNTGRPKSTYVSATTMLPPPPPPSDFEASLDPGGTLVTLSWTHASPTKEYGIRWKRMEDSDEDWMGIGPIMSPHPGAAEHNPDGAYVSRY